MIRSSLPEVEVARWDILIILFICCLIVMWALLVAPEVRGWVLKRRANGVVSCPLCRTRHGPGQCPRDKVQTPDAGDSA